MSDEPELTTFVRSSDQGEQFGTAADVAMLVGPIAAAVPIAWAQVKVARINAEAAVTVAEIQAGQRD